MLHTGIIPASKTRGPIRWTYIKAARTSPADGSLTLTEDVGKVVSRVISSSYDVAEEPPPAGMKGRQFLMVKTDHQGDLDTVKGKESAKRVGDVYQCRLFTDDQTSCTCPAGNTEHARPGTGRCIQILALRSLTESGVFEDNSPAPADRVGTENGEWGTPHPSGGAWWAEAAGGRLEPEPLGC